MESVRAAVSEHRRRPQTDQGGRAGIKRAADQNRQFGGQKAPEFSLPEGYEEKLTGTLKKAAATYAEQRKNGNYVNATKQALKYLNEDAAFSNAIHQLFSNISPMP